MGGFDSLQRLRFRSRSESDLDSGDSVYYDCIEPGDPLKVVTFATEEDVRFYDRVTDESRSNSLSQSTPPISTTTSETNLNGGSRFGPWKARLQDTFLG